MKTGRNDPCPCGSGKKYKKCCERDEAASSTVAGTNVTESVQSVLQKALQYHQSGGFAEAEVLYRQVLQKDPKQPDALHLLGLIAHQRGDYAEAERLIKEAVSRDDKVAFFYLNLGNALKEQGKVDEAIGSYKKAIRLEPNLAEAHYNLANELQIRGDHEDAAGEYLQAIRLNPGFAEAYYNLGLALKNLDRMKEATESIEAAICLTPAYAEAHHTLGVILSEEKRYDEAIFHFKMAVQIKPDYADVHFDLADLLRKTEKSEEAEMHFRRVIELKPDFVDAYNNLAIVMRQQGRIDEAIAAYNKALEIDHNFLSAYSNLAGVLQEDGQIEQAIACCKKALEIKPDFADAHWNLALALLFSGDFASGWKEYDWRFLKVDPVYRPFPQPTWDGSSLKGKTLLIYSEQGIGDHIMFASMIGEIVEQCDRCIIECDFRLVSLFQRSFPDAIVIPIVANPEEFHTCGTLPIDYKVAMGSLPFFLRPDFKSFSLRKNYLEPDSREAMKWKRRFDDLGPGLKVGISWRGGKERSVRTMRSTMLDQWLEILPMAGVHFINLQYGDTVQELQEVKEKYGVTIHHWEDSNPLKDMDGFAAQISDLESVISVDNSTVHMSGSLGVPTWTLLPKGCDWRWMKKAEDTPWYPSVRLIRQKNHGEWRDVLERVALMLKRSVGGQTIAGTGVEHPYKTSLPAAEKSSVMPVRRSYSDKTYTCAVITPVGPGHKELYRSCLDSINRTFAKNKGRFSAIIPLAIDDTKGKLGRSRARNLAIHEAAGNNVDWIFFLDADDEMAPGAFDMVSPYLDEYDAIWGGIWSIEKGEMKAKERPGQLPFLMSIDDVLSCDPFVTLQMGHFVKTSVALPVLFNETLDTGEDFDYYMRVWSKYQCIKIPAPFFYNRRGYHSAGPKSATGGDWRQQVEKILDEYRKSELKIRLGQ